MVRLRPLFADTRAASAVEFALVMPLLLLFLFGIIDAGRFMWEYNKAEKATQVGARMAVVTNVIPGGLASASYVGQTVNGVTLTQGDRIPAAALDTLSCSRTACTCVPNGGNCPSPGTIDTASFDLIVARMQAMKPDINPANVLIQYSGSGLGFAGDPNGMEIAPLVTVKLSPTPAATALKFTPLTGFLFATMTMPDFRTTMPAEDLSGTQSN
jgi:Flp pilus assembly protein TadG